MPGNDDPVSKALAGAKSALAGARKFTASVGDTEPSKVSPKPAPQAAAPAPKPAASGIAKEAEDAGKGVAINLQKKKEVIDSMAKGGPINKTGLYKLHKGEEVVPADKAESGKLDKKSMNKATEALGGKKEGGKKHGFGSLQVDHHSNGSHTVRHRPDMNKETTGSPSQEVSYAVGSNKELFDKLKEYLGGDEAEEAQESKE